MYLKSLEISGFKSFAKKGFLEFKTPISAIVGPNGSGKSNIAEAFRFVLGEQSIKNLRGKRGEDLIFSGSKEERSMNRAGVKVIFDNTTRFLDIDYDEVIIERIVHRDGVNQYFINKSKVRLKDISELLAGANIGSSGHHIISQGESDKILNVNSKDRREMIEEALGLRVYQFKISESNKKLVKVEENIKSIESLIKEVAPHLRFLKKQVKKIEQSFELKEKLRTLYKEYFKRESEYLKYQKNYIQENKSPLKEEINRLDNELEIVKTILKQEEKVEENKELINLEYKLKEIRIKKDELGRKIGRVEGMITFEERRLKREEERQSKEEERLIKFKEVRKFTDELYSQLSSQTYEGNALVNKIREIISNFISNNSQNEQKIEISGDELLRLQNEKKDIENKMVLMEEEEENILSELNDLQKEIESEKDSSRKAEVKIFEIKAKQSEIFAKLNSIKDLEARIEIEDENYKKELNESFVLAGREATQFSDFTVSLDEVISESRGEQDNRRRSIEKIKIKLEDTGVGSGDDVIKEYKEAQERDEFLKNEIGDLERSSISLKELIAELKEKLDVEFKEGVEKINNQFNEFFATMFGGGKAELLVVKIKKRKKNKIGDLEVGLLGGDIDENDEYQEEQEGIDVNVELPNKKTKGLQMLSGGERSLTSIALLFAMSQIKPPPFIILDETDAALDEANSRRYGDMIENLSEYSQLILITHNRETMSRAGVLYGITMGMDGVSRLLSVKLEEAIKVAK